MPAHTAKTLFDKNIESADHCLKLFAGVSNLNPPGLDLDWILRAAIVFIVSAIDTYFHDKVRYRVARYSLESLPPALAKFQVGLSNISEWEDAERKGNVLRNWVTRDLSSKPLQSMERIADALKLAGIENLWATIEPTNGARDTLRDRFNALVKRRNQIAHEGDREQSRRSGKKLRAIKVDDVKNARAFAVELVKKIENAFPR